MLDQQNETPALDLQAGNSTLPKTAGNGSKQISFLQETLLNLHRATPAWANSFTTQPCEHLTTTPSPTPTLQRKAGKHLPHPSAIKILKTA